MMDAILVLGAGFVNYIIGWIWYSIFGAAWMEEQKLKEEGIDRKDPKPYLIALIGSLWSSYGIFLLIKHIQPQNILELLSLGFATWLLVLVGFAAKHYAFQGKTMKAFMIDYGVNLIGILAMCLIIG